MGARSGWRRSSGAKNLFNLTRIKANKFRGVAASVFPVYLNEASNEKLLLLIGARLPVIGFADVDDEANVASPFSLLGVYIWGSERFDTGEVVQIPGLANRKGAIRILLGFVDTDASGLAHSDNYDAGFLGLGTAGLGGWRRSLMRTILCDSNMCDVGFEN